MKTGLLLAGGAMRGMYTAGVLDIFMDNGIAVDGIVGISAGAVFGVNFLSGQRGRVIRYNKRFNGDRNYMGLKPLLFTGNIVDTQYAYRLVPEKLDRFDDVTYQASGIPFYAGITCLETGEAKLVKIDSVFGQMDVLRASASMPFVSRAVEIEGFHYLDGDVADGLPWRKMFAMGYDRLIVILTRERGYRKKPVSPLMAEMRYGRHRAFKQALLSRHARYNESVGELERLQEEGRVCLIAPSAPITIGRIEKDPERLQGVYELGLGDGEKALGRLGEFL